MDEVGEILVSILEGRDGFRLGEPWTLGSDTLGAVIPILRHTEEERDYVTLTEVKDKVKLEDTGSISGVKINGAGVDKPVLILAGEVLEGEGTQSRGVVHSMVVMPDEVKTIETRCVHKSHPITVKAGFRPVGLAPRKVVHKLVSRSQSSVWSAVDSFATYALSSTISAHRPRTGGQWSGYQIVSTDSLPKAMKLMESKVRDVVEKVPCFEGQVGVIVIGMNGIEGIEVFDHPKSWEARYKDVMGKYADTLTEKAELFTLNKEACMVKAKEFLNVLIKSDRETIKENGCKVVKIESDEFIGEAVVFNGRTIHLFAVKKDDMFNYSTVTTDVSIGSPSITTTDRMLVRFPTTSTVNFNEDRWYNEPTVSDIFSKRKGWDSVVSTLQSNPQGMTWTELRNKTNLNPVTLTKRLKEGKAVGIIKEDLRSNGKKVYRLGRIWTSTSISGEE